MFLTDDEGQFTFICPNVDVIFGYVPDEVRAMTRIGGLLGEGLFERADLDARGEIRNIEREVASKSGERRSILIHLKKVSIQGSTVLYTCRDVTERAPGLDRPRDQPAADVHPEQRERRHPPAHRRRSRRRGGAARDLRRYPRSGPPRR